MAKEDAHQPGNHRPVEVVFHEARFSDVKLDDAAPPRFEFRPEIGGVYAAKLERSQMLVLGGHDLEDKGLFAKHLAYSLQERLNRPIPVKQWHPALAPQGFDEALHRFTTETIVLFPEVCPHHFGYDLARLLDEIRQHDKKGHKLYAILTTDWRCQDWRLERNLAEEIWCDLSTENIYPPDFLNNILDLELRNRPEITWPDTYTARCVAERLRIPSRVRSFAFSIRARQDLDQPTDAKWIEEILQQLSGAGVEIGRWYRNLDPRLQKLALSLALLDGFFRDQALAALAILSARVWRQFHPQFEAFAARELPSLGAYFRETAEGNGHPQVTCLSPRHRREILKVAWECYPNELTAALTVVAEIAADAGSFDETTGLPRDGRQTGAKEGEGKQKPDTTADEKKGDKKNEGPPGNLEDLFAGWLPPGYARALFGSPERIQQVQWAISETLSEIGKRIGFEAIENTLLYLAKGEHFASWRVAASVLALWRKVEAGEDAKQSELAEAPEERVNFLCDTLERWLKEAFVLQRKHPAQSVYVRATVAVAVSYAALFDPFNGLTKRLRNLFEQIALDREGLAGIYFRRHTVPWIAALNLGQKEVEAFLQDQIGQEDDFHSRFGLAQGLAVACSISVQRKKALDILQRWFEEGMRSPQQQGWRAPANNRLVAAALAYGWIAADGLDGDDCPRAEILSRLRRVHGREENILLDLLIIQSLRNLEGVAPGLGDLFRRLSRQELEDLAEILEDLYRHEREKQPPYGSGSDPNKRRRLTEVEEVMEHWLLDRNHKKVMRLAVCTLIRISEGSAEKKEWLDHLERVWKERILRKGRIWRFFAIITRSGDLRVWQRSREKLASQIEDLKKEELRDPLFLTPVLWRFSVFLATLFSPRDRIVTQAHFAELLLDWKSAVTIMRHPREHLGAIFYRYDGNSEELSRIINHLAHSVWLFRYRWPLMAANGLLFAGLGINIWAYWG